MAIESIASVKGHFESGDRPTEQEFINLIDTLGRVTPLAIASAAEGGKTGVYEILGDGDVTARSTGTIGLTVLAAGTTTTILDTLGVTSGQAIFLASDSTASSRSLLGSGTVGDLIFQVDSTASALTELGIVTANSSGAGLASIALKADMEATTSAKVVDAAIMHHHPAMPKAIVRITDCTANPQTVTVMYSVVGGVSAARSVAGEYIVGWGTTLTNPNVQIQSEAPASAAGRAMTIREGTLGGTSVGVLSENVTDGVQADCNAYSLWIYGTLP